MDKTLGEIDFCQAMLKTREQLKRYVIITEDGEPYLERVILDESTYLHFIYRSDLDRDPHDHPFDFSSRILHGEYREHRYDVGHCQDHIEADPLCIQCNAAPLMETSQLYVAGNLNIKNAAQLHRLVLTAPVITLVTRGPKIRDWGFQTPKGWVDHVTYITERYGSVSEYE